MDLYDKKGSAVLWTIIILAIGALITYWGVVNYLGLDDVTCKLSVISGPSCRTKFGFIMILVFVVEIFGLNYIRSNYLGYYIKNK